jgi:hypothetical protein
MFMANSIQAVMAGSERSSFCGVGCGQDLYMAVRIKMPIYFKSIVYLCEVYNITNNKSFI